MILLDTNVLSELLKQRGNTAVRGWVQRNIANELSLFAPVLAEINAGIALLDEGRRKRDLVSTAVRVTNDLFGGEVVAFDRRAAEAFGEVALRLKSFDTKATRVDAMIAAIALVHGAVVATRDIAPFAAAGVAHVDPFEA